LAFLGVIYFEKIAFAVTFIFNRASVDFKSNLGLLITGAWLPYSLSYPYAKSNLDW
jgi:hypothetical protein